MTAIAIAPPPLDSDELAGVLAEIAADARRRRIEAPHERPDLALALVRRHRLGAVRIPVADGGAGYSKRESFSLFIRLAEADSDVPHILRLHYGFVEELLRHPKDYADRPFLAQILDGKLFGGAAAELGNRPGIYTYDTTLLPDGDDFRLNGRKFYSTGSLYSDYLRIAAGDATGERVSVLIPADREGVEHVDDWDGIGQRHTGSGTTVLDNVLVHASEVLPAHSRRQGAHAQLLLHAVAAGILRELTSDAAELLRGRTRSYSWGNHDEFRHDPQFLQIVGELSATAYVVEAAVLAAADAQERADAHHRAHGVPDEALEHEASLQASKVKVGVEESALRGASAVFGAGGASSTRATHQLDRHWRNLRTLFSHNPTVFKARAVGDAVVNGTALPTVGYF